MKTACCFFPLGFDLCKFNIFRPNSFLKAINNRWFGLEDWWAIYSPLLSKAMERGFRSRMGLLPSLPVHGGSFGIPRLLHLCVQSIHHVSFSGTLWPGVESHGPLVRRQPPVHQLVLTAKRPMKILDLSIVTLPGLSLSKFSSFGLDPAKLEQSWNTDTLPFPERVPRNIH